RPELLRLARVEPLEREPDTGPLMTIGRAPDRELMLDERGRVLARDLATEELWVEGSGFARWLDAVMAREGVLYDRHGEFREEAFDGGDLSTEARRKRAQAALKADPDSPAWNIELAELFVEGGERESAMEALARALELAPGAAGAW